MMELQFKTTNANANTNLEGGENMRCRLCGNQIKDYGILIANGLQAPKLCFSCRYNVYDYKPKKINVDYELELARIIKLDKSFVLYIQYEKEVCHPPLYKKAYIFSIGGRRFGRWGGARHSGKYLMYFYAYPEEEKVYLIRKMRKRIENREWVFLVFEPYDDTKENNISYLKFKFTRIWKWTLKGYGRQFDNTYPIEEPHEIILEGGSRANTGRFGNRWAVYISLPNEQSNFPEVGSDINID